MGDISPTVPVGIDTELADELVAFAATQGLILDEDCSQQERIVDALGFVLGLAEGLTSLQEIGLLEPTPCRSCGCSDIRACVRTHPAGVHVHASGAHYDVCRWVESDLCSACAPGAADGWLHPADQQEAAAA